MAGLAALIFGCSQPAPIATVAQVDLERFMGEWFVIASIPTFLDKNVRNATETYRRAADGSIETRYCFRGETSTAETRCYHPRAFVRDGHGNAVWDMQFVWPFEAEYRIIYLAPDYSRVIVGRSQRDHAWIMARKPEVTAPDYAAMLAFLAGQGYDISLVEQVPQHW